FWTPIDSLRQHSHDSRMVHTQLAGNGADPPFFDVIIAQDLRFELGRNGHRALPNVLVAVLPLAAAQEVDADERLAGRAAPVATAGWLTVTWEWRCDVIRGGRRRAVRRRSRVHRHSITRRRRWGTLMRHVLLPGAPATATCRVVHTAASARLVALASGTLGLIPRLLRAAA